jgi:hypothetical protein
MKSSLIYNGFDCRYDTECIIQNISHLYHILYNNIYSTYFYSLGIGASFLSIYTLIYIILNIMPEQKTIPEEEKNYAWELPYEDEYSF